MWDSETVQKINTQARPIRVAYLVEPEKDDQSTFDLIAKDAFSRWGGRRSLIVPLKDGNIADGYEPWLEAFDADILYCFESLSADQIATYNQRYSPLHLIEHREQISTVELPVNCLSSLSVLPNLSKTSVNYSIGPKPRLVLSRNSMGNISEDIGFLTRNFGFFSDVFNTGTQGSKDTEIYTSLSLIDEETLNKPSIGKEREATHVTSIKEVFEAFDTKPELVTPAQLADTFAPTFTKYHHGVGTTFSLVVGDTPIDRILAWNRHLLFNRDVSHGFSGFHLTRVDTDSDYFCDIIRLAAKRGVFDTTQKHILLSSASMKRECLDRLATKIRDIDNFLVVQVIENSNLSSIVPEINSQDRNTWTFGGLFGTSQGEASSEYTDNRALLPLSIPTHLTQQHPKHSIYPECWMLDVKIERHNDHCQAVNLRHEWLFPRKLRIDRAFDIKCEPSQFSRENTRVNYQSRMAFAVHEGITAASISIPSDECESACKIDPLGWVMSE